MARLNASRLKLLAFNGVPAEHRSIEREYLSPLQKVSFAVCLFATLIMSQVTWEPCLSTISAPPIETCLCTAVFSSRYTWWKQFSFTRFEDYSSISGQIKTEKFISFVNWLLDTFQTLRETADRRVSIKQRQMKTNFLCIESHSDLTETKFANAF